MSLLRLFVYAKILIFLMSCKNNVDNVLLFPFFLKTRKWNAPTFISSRGKTSQKMLPLQGIPSLLTKMKMETNVYQDTVVTKCSYHNKKRKVRYIFIRLSYNK